MGPAPFDETHHRMSLPQAVVSAEVRDHHARDDHEHMVVLAAEDAALIDDPDTFRCADGGEEVELLGVRCHATERTAARPKKRTVLGPHPNLPLTPKNTWICRESKSQRTLYVRRSGIGPGNSTICVCGQAIGWKP